MPFEIQSGPAQVIICGTSTTFQGHPLCLHLVDGEIDLSVELCFETDSTVEGVVVNSEAMDGGICLRVINCDDDYGRGSAQPVLLAETTDDLFFFHFRAFLHGRTTDHTVHYSFYRVSKDEVCWQPRVDRDE